MWIAPFIASGPILMSVCAELVLLCGLTPHMWHKVASLGGPWLCYTGSKSGISGVRNTTMDFPCLKIVLREILVGWLLSFLTIGLTDNCHLTTVKGQQQLSPFYYQFLLLLIGQCTKVRLSSVVLIIVLQLTLILVMQQALWLIHSLI